MKKLKKICILASSILAVSSMSVISTNAMGLGFRYEIIASQTEYTIPKSYDFTIDDVKGFNITKVEKFYHDMPEDPLIGEVTYGDTPYNLNISSITLDLDNSTDTEKYYIVSAEDDPKNYVLDDETLTLKTEIIPDEEDTNKATFVISFEDDYYMNDYDGLTVNLTYENASIGESDTEYPRGDVNQDGKTNSLDLLYLKKYLLGLIEW